MSDSSHHVSAIAIRSQISGCTVGFQLLLLAPYASEVWRHLTWAVDHTIKHMKRTLGHEKDDKGKIGVEEMF